MANSKAKLCFQKKTNVFTFSLLLAIGTLCVVSSQISVNSMMEKGNARFAAALQGGVVWSHEERIAELEKKIKELEAQQKLIVTSGVLSGSVTSDASPPAIKSATPAAAEYEGTAVATASKRWTEDQIVSYMKENPQRAHFSRLFRDGGFRSGMEVGVAGGKFSEHYLRDLKSISGLEWTMVEPFPIKTLKHNYDPKTGEGKWKEEGLLDGVKHTFHEKLSLDEDLLAQLPDESYDFIYLDGDHSYKGVRGEMPLYWSRVKKGGVLAGHDYCNLGEKNLPCKGCDNVPLGGFYPEGSGERSGQRVKNQNGVVKAVQEWLMENPTLTLHHTAEDFTRESLSASGMDFDLIATSTRNPSWFIVKPSE